MEKQCLYCRKIFTKSKTVSFREWTTVTKYCSRTCFGSSNIGKDVTVDTRKKMSIAHRGKVYKPCSLETKLRISQASRGRRHRLWGKHHSEETKKRIGAGNKGKYVSAETRLKMSLIHKGHGRPSHRKGIPLPDEWRNNIRLAMQGSKNPNFKNGKGVTPISAAIRASKRYLDWRVSVFQRDNYTCVFCGAKNGQGKTVKLNADHIKSFAHYPELRFAIDNGRTLCVPCHKKTDTYGGRGRVKDSQI